MSNVNIAPLADESRARKVSIQLPESLQKELALFSDAYEEDYGSRPKEPELLVALIETALARDTSFKRYKRALKRRDKANAAGDTQHPSSTETSPIGQDGGTHHE